jgi:TNF receptor-associated factor 4
MTGEREIESLRVRCNNRDHGCQWEGELRALEKHFTECSKELIPCKYQSIGCKIKVVKSELSSHEEACTEKHLKMAVEQVKLLTQQRSVISVNLLPIVMKMSGFAQHRISKSLWDSQPFYTSPKGYKLYLQVNVFGTGYSSECIAARVCLMCGDHDDNLVWPFRGTVNFRLLNQDQDSDHIAGEAKFLERKESLKNRRVSAAEGKSVVGWGSRDMLQFSDPHFTRYVQKDCVYFSVDKVEVSVLNKPWLI